MLSGGSAGTARRAALTLPIDIDDVRRAAERVTGIVHRTPVLTSRSLDERTGARVYCKAEQLQRTGSFKFRGACNAVASLSGAERARGIAAYSSGNHAQAVALAASLHDSASVILMPEDAPASKRDATLGYGAEIVTYDRYAEERTDIGERLAEERGAVLVPPFEHPAVMAGQGTSALELFEEIGDLDLLLVCLGGGGLISGCATVAHSRARPPRVIGVEPAAGDDVKRSLESGRIVSIPTPRTIADGQQTTSPGPLTFSVIRERVDEIVTATDAQIVQAMRFAFERMKIVLEPSGACALAALLSGVVDARGLRVGVTLSGGNIDVVRFRALLEQFAEAPTA